LWWVDENGKWSTTYTIVLKNIKEWLCYTLCILLIWYFGSGSTWSLIHLHWFINFILHSFSLELFPLSLCVLVVDISKELLGEITWSSLLKLHYNQIVYFMLWLLELLHTHLGFIFPKVIPCLLVIVSYYPVSYILGENIPPGEYCFSVDTSVWLVELSLDVALVLSPWKIGIIANSLHFIQSVNWRLVD